MKILIAYAGKTGTTEKCAEILAQKLENVTTLNLAKQDVDISKYDLIVIGSSVRMGMLCREVKEFINKKKDTLKNKNVAYYICCGFPDHCKEYFEKNIEKELLDNAITYDTFGGEMDLSKQKGFDKLIVSMVNKSNQGKKEVKILSENIEEFAQKIREIK